MPKLMLIPIIFVMLFTSTVFAKNNSKSSVIVDNKNEKQLLLNNTIKNYMTYKKALILFITKQKGKPVLLREYLFDCDDLRIRDVDIFIYDIKNDKLLGLKNKANHLQKGWRYVDINGTEGKLLEKVCTR